MVVEELRGDFPPADLFPAEAAAVAAATEQRRREFSAVRRCARRGLVRLGLPPTPIVPGPDRAPRWPEGVVGSLTHCEGYAAAALAPASRLLGLGVDAEPDAPLPAEVVELVADRRERAALPPRASGAPAWDRLVFSAKESVFKACYPLDGRWLEWDDLRVEVAPTGRFTADLAHAGPGGVRRVEGRWVRLPGLVLTAVALPGASRL